MAPAILGLQALEVLALDVGLPADAHIGGIRGALHPEAQLSLGSCRSPGARAEGRRRLSAARARWPHVVLPVSLQGPVKLAAGWTAGPADVHAGQVEGVLRKLACNSNQACLPGW